MRTLSCELVREALSARLDGEEPSARPDREAELGEHLATCDGCARFAVGSERLGRRLRVHLATEAPDQRAAILASARALGACGGRREGIGRRAVTLARTRWRPAVRWAVAVVPLGVAVPLLALGVLGHPHLVPSHPPTPCTRDLVRGAALARSRGAAVLRG